MLVGRMRCVYKFKQGREEEHKNKLSMQDVKITIEDLGTVAKDSTATEAAQKAIYAENERSESAYCITLRGAYERKYYFVTELTEITAERTLLDGDLLIVCLWSDIVVIDMSADKICNVINVTPYLDMFAIYKFKGGYFVHGETENRFFDSDFNLRWEKSGRNIFYCPDREKSVEIFEDHIDVWDFLGYKYSYDEWGDINSYIRTTLRKQ